MGLQFYIGKRLSYDGRLCTVRYHGEVQGTKGEWLGVEWDDPTRGKHAGEHQGVKYFDCLHHSPTSASFIRPTRPPDPSLSFPSALKSKYASDARSSPPLTDPSVQIVFDNHPNRPPPPQPRPIKFSGKVAEEVGFDKIRAQLAQLSELRIVILDGLGMCRPEVRGDGWMGGRGKRDVEDACPKAGELDLSRNLFEEWREVGSICEQLEKLRNLRVDGNRFRDTTLSETERERCLKAFANINTLRLEENLLPWDELARLTQLFPTLTIFGASSNLYTALGEHMLNPTITDLTLEDNLLPSLSNIASLTKLPHLQRLVLKSNKISEISSSPASIPIFPSTLTEVDLSFNEIAIWAFIETLAHVFPGLTSLRVSHNPLYESLQAPDGRALTADDGYMLTFARLGNLSTLNHSPINPKERLNAESYYLSMIAKEVQFAPENMTEQILKSHPRYKWLCEEYGEPDVQRSANKVNPNSLAARLLRIRFYLAADKSSTYEAEIPMSCTAYTVLGMVGKHFGIQPTECKLLWETGDWMPAKSTVVDFDEDEWDSEDSEKEGKVDRIMREVEVVPGTRSIGTWVDGSEAIIRVEIEPWA
ncbi:tubulin-specific chaperone E [Phaeosphaeria sp. MPI-PUGE-AT-0046c]|nr:tubulin-specific chaperone E [Phaeosphaeria sp. MPI-PUGE-AT-0046c]